MKPFLVFCLFLVPVLCFGQSSYWYQNGQLDQWHLQPDVFAFRMQGGVAYGGPIDSSLVELFIYAEGRRDKANEIYFKPGSSIDDRIDFVESLGQYPGFEMPYPVVTKNPLLDYKEDAWYIIDDLVLVNFQNPMSKESLEIFMAEYHLSSFHVPSSSLPDGGNYTYVFALDPQFYREENAANVSALLIELDSNVVQEASPNFVNIRLGEAEASASEVSFINVQPQSDCNSLDPLIDFQWYIENPGGFQVSYIDSAGGQNFSPASPANADAGICECWNESLSGEGITVGIITDGAFDYTHPDIGNYGPGWDCTVPCIALDRTSSPMEVDASGTYLASIVAAERNNSMGIAGIAYESTLNGYRIDETTNSTSWLILVRAIQQAISDDVDVLMLGWMFSPGLVSVQIELDNAILNGRDRNNTPYGMILVATPGGGVNTSQLVPSFPAAYNGVLSVIGTNPVDQLCTPGDGFDQLNPPQPYGSVFGNQYDLAAPTLEIFGHDITNGYGWATSGVGILGDDYNSAPSEERPFAAPTVVAGIAALLLDAREQILWNDLQQLLMDGAEQVGGYPYSVMSGKSNELGHGRVNCHVSFLLETLEEQALQAELEIVNPLQEELLIISKYDQNLNLELVLHDLSGRQILAKYVSLTPGANGIAMPFMASGMYVLTLVGKDGESFSRKLIKP